MSDLGNQEEIAAVGAVAAGAGVSPIPGLPSLHEIQLIAAISSLPDSAVVEPAIAAIFLRRSEQTLARMRSEGSGPPFYQPNEGRGRNAKVTYLMGDLRAWHGAGKVSSTMEAAKQRGLCFASMADLVPEQPFWSSPSGRLHSPALIGAPSEFDDKLRLEPAEFEIVWISMVEAMAQPWSDVVSRRLIYNRYVELLAEEAARAFSAQERSEFDSALG